MHKIIILESEQFGNIRVFVEAGEPRKGVFGRNIRLQACEHHPLDAIPGSAKGGKRQ